MEPHKWTFLQSIEDVITPLHQQILQYYNVTHFLNGSPIKSASNCKDLGIIISSDLSLSQYYNKIISRAYCHLAFIRHIFNVSLHTRVKKMLYISLVMSQLIYCSQVWRPQMIKDIIAFEKVQRRATKYILSDSANQGQANMVSYHSCICLTIKTSSF